MTLPDLSYYKGDFCKGIFHGDGVFCITSSPMMYSGQWKGGKKHGKVEINIHILNVILILLSTIFP